MTTAERALVMRLRRRAAALSPDLAREQLRAYELIRELLTESELAAAIRDGTLERLIGDLTEHGRLDESFLRFRLRTMQGVLDAATSEARVLPAVVQSPVFNRLSPFVINAADALASRVVQGLSEDARATVLQAASDGLREGVGPRTVARRVRSVLGLAPNQEAAVANFRRMLEAGDREALTRALRDKRFDATLKRVLGKERLSAEQVERMTAAYRRRMIAFNAETHARTLALDAQKLAQRLAWQDAIDKGIVSRNDLVREWVTVGDDRVRPEHQDMNGERAGWDEPFSNGELTPGESTYNCRCVARTILQRARVAA